MRRSFFARVARAPRKAGPVGAAAVAASALVIAQAGAAVAAPAVTAKRASAAVAQRPLTAAQAATLSVNATQHVIIFLRDEPRVSAGRSAMAARSAAIASSQRGVVSELAQVHAKREIAYRLVNAVAATVSAGEETRLKANPAVEEVIPDAIIQGPAAAAAPAVPATATAKPSTIKPLPGACLRHGKVQLEPEALQVTNTQSLNPREATARKLGFTGAGVAVAYIADGIDIHNVNFIKPDGKSVFSYYVDFTGDGTHITSGGGGEAFLDANSIAGQGRKVYNVQNFGPQTLTEPCNIRIEGVAPGVSLEGLRVFGVNNQTTTSAFLDAINYATVVHPVNVLNESFGSNGIPDTSVDAVKEFDDAAVAAGVTVVVASGDSSPGTNTIGSPATDPNVISVGASTDFRAYAMSNYLEADKFGRTGWLDNNISNISSSGFNAFGAGIDLVAPGDQSFTSCSTNVNLYPDCFNDLGLPSPVQLTGGTSQSSPLTAGVAALVIQAFRKTHEGSTPTPAVVKQIIMSSATDLGSAGDEQGAGLLNAYKSVELAESFPGGSAAVGKTLLTAVTGVSGLDPSASRAGQIDIQGMPNSPETGTFSITNTGSGGQTVHISGRTLGPVRYVQRGTITISNKHSRHFIDFVGFKNNYGEFHFTVHPRQNRLNVSMAFPTTFNDGAGLSMILIDPKGRFAANSLPQGISRDANLDVINPAAGRWTAVVFGPVGGQPLFGTTGKVPLLASTQQFVRFGKLSASTVTLARGASATVTLSVATPRSPGDQDGSIVLNAGNGASTIPVLLRSYVNVAAPGGGNFSGNLIGGNGRGPGQFDYYEFQVGAGSPDITAKLKLHNDADDLVDTYLVDPSGQIDGYGTNYRITEGSSGYASGLTADASAVNAVPGIWELVVEFVDPTGGNEISDPYTGNISLTAGAAVTANPLAPADNARVATGTSKTFTVQIKNNGDAPEDIFLDPRLTGAQVSYTLVSQTDNEIPVPVPTDGSIAAPPEWLVPTESSSVTASATVSASQPITFDLQPLLGDPDVPSFPPGAAAGSTTPSVTVPGESEPGPLTAGAWDADPAPAAPQGFSNADSQSENATFNATVQTQPFDTTVTSSAGDYWYTGVNPSATSNVTVLVGAGKTATIQVTVTPTASVGTTVSGTLYVDDFIPIFYPTEQYAGNELAAVPYQYTVSS
jgi:Subtilase family